MKYGKTFLAALTKLENISYQSLTLLKISFYAYTYSQLDFPAIINKLLGSISLKIKRALQT